MTVTTKHTPGPLKARRNLGAALGSDQPQPYIVEGSQGQGWTALVGLEADARLYAAAPDLLAACETCVQVLAAQDQNQRVVTAETVVLYAIRKATSPKVGGEP